VASAVYVIYLATGYTNVERFEPGTFVEAADGIGAAGYVLVGILGLLGGVAYLSNVVGLGHPGNLISGGTLPLLNAVVGLEVAAGFVLLAKEFLDQTEVVRAARR
jgi:multicomponent Na+:H+ antiporter subunit B